LRKIRINVQIMVPDTRELYFFKEVELKRVAKKINVWYVGSVLLWAFENPAAVLFTDCNFMKRKKKYFPKFPGNNHRKLRFEIFINQIPVFISL
jgi:hypothetical protein